MSTETSASSAKLNKRTLDDLELTKHRLSKLQLEEKRLLGQINLATHRSRSLQSRRQNTHEVNEELKAHREEIERRQGEIRNLVSSSRQRRAEAMDAAKKRLLAQRRSAAEEVQRESKMNDFSYRASIEEERAKMLSRRKGIRELETTMKARRDKAAVARLQSVKQQIDKEIEYDSKERNEKEKEAKRMKTQEAEMRDRIEKLRTKKQQTNQELDELYHTETPSQSTARERSPEDSAAAGGTPASPEN